MRNMGQKSFKSSTSGRKQIPSVSITNKQIDELSSCKLFSNSPLSKGLTQSHLKVSEYKMVVAEVFAQIAMVKQSMEDNNYRPFEEAE
jgi:hypothetical protein